MRTSISIKLTFILLFIAFSLHSCVYDAGENLFKHGKYSKDIPAEYINLFTSKAQKKFDYFGTQTMSSGLKVSSFDYVYITRSGNAYGNQFELFEIGLKQDEPLNKIIHIDTNPVSPADTSFINLIQGDIDFDYKDGKKDSVSDVALNYEGDILKTNFENDTLVCYDMQFKTFSINYDNGSKFLVIKNGLLFIHEYAKLIFLKKNKKLYTIFIYEPILAPTKPDTTLTLFN